MAKTSQAAAAPAAAPLVAYLTAPSGGTDGVPYQGPQRRVAPEDQVPPGARILGPVEEVEALEAAAGSIGVAALSPEASNA